MNQYGNNCLHGEYHKTSLICCFIVTTQNLIWPVVFYFYIHGDWQRIQIYLQECNVHENGITQAQKFVHSIDWEYNWELLIVCPHMPLCFKKIRTTTTTKFLISNTVVLNPYSHSTFDPQSFAPLHLYLKFQVHLIDLSKSDIQILYGLQIDNGIRQC